MTERSAIYKPKPNNASEVYGIGIITDTRLRKVSGKSVTYP